MQISRLSSGKSFIGKRKKFQRHKVTTSHSLAFPHSVVPPRLHSGHTAETAAAAVASFSVKQQRPSLRFSLPPLSLSLSLSTPPSLRLASAVSAVQFLCLFTKADGRATGYSRRRRPRRFAFKLRLGNGPALSSSCRRAFYDFARSSQTQ